MTYEERLTKRLGVKAPSFKWTFEHKDIKGTTSLIIIAEHPETQEQAAISLGSDPQDRKRHIMINTILAVVKSKLGEQDGES